MPLKNKRKTHTTLGAVLGLWFSIDPALAQEPAQSSQTVTPAKPTELNELNLKTKHAMDRQFDQWKATADRALRSVCVGCNGPSRNVGSRGHVAMPVGEDDVPFAEPEAANEEHAALPAPSLSHSESARE